MNAKKTEEFSWSHSRHHTKRRGAKAVIQDIASYEQMQEAIALLKILALGERQIEEGRAMSVASAMKSVRARAAAVRR